MNIGHFHPFVSRRVTDWPSTRAKRVLGWAPEYVFDDGLRELVDWFKKEAR